MSKKTTETNQQSTESGKPAYLDELLTTGTTILTAQTREELAEMVDNIAASVRYAVGAVGQNPETGAFTLRVDLSND